MTDQLRDRRNSPVFIHSSLDDLRLSMEAFRVYCHLARRVNENNKAWPSYRTLGECCFRGSYPNSNSDSLRRKAISAVQELIQWNLIAVEKRPTGDGSQTSNLYSLTDENEWNTSNTTPSINARKSRTYQPRQKAEGDRRSEGDGSSQGIVIPIHTGEDTYSKGVVLGVHQSGDDGSPGLVKAVHHSSDDHTPPLVIGVHQDGDRGSPKGTPIEVTPIEVTPIEGGAAAVDRGAEEVDGQEFIPNPGVLLPAKTKNRNRKTKTTVEDKSSAVTAIAVQNTVDSEILNQLQAMIYDWRQRPWMDSALQFKPEVIQAVWRSNIEWYSLPGTNTPNLKKISDRLKKLDNQLKKLNADAVAAYFELQNYWTTAEALANPIVEQAFTSAAATAKQQQTYAEYESALKRHQTGGFFG